MSQMQIRHVILNLLVATWKKSKEKQVKLILIIHVI